jgi:hypothetical protein
MNASEPRTGRGAAALKALARFALGAAIGVFLHYLLFRTMLPQQPFIYVAF